MHNKLTEYLQIPYLALQKCVKVVNLQLIYCLIIMHQVFFLNVHIVVTPHPQMQANFVQKPGRLFYLVMRHPSPHITPHHTTPHHTTHYYTLPLVKIHLTLLPYRDHVWMWAGWVWSLILWCPVSFWCGKTELAYFWEVAMVVLSQEKLLKK